MQGFIHDYKDMDDELKSLESELSHTLTNETTTTPLPTTTLRTNVNVPLMPFNLSQASRFYANDTDVVDVVDVVPNKSTERLSPKMGRIQIKMRHLNKKLPKRKRMRVHSLKQFTEKKAKESKVLDV